jgi:hypothetical protein
MGDAQKSYQGIEWILYKEANDGTHDEPEANPT